MIDSYLLLREIGVRRLRHRVGDGGWGGGVGGRGLEGWGGAGGGGWGVVSAMESYYSSSHTNTRVAAVNRHGYRIAGSCCPSVHGELHKNEGTREKGGTGLKLCRTAASSSSCSALCESCPHTPIDDGCRIRNICSMVLSYLMRSRCGRSVKEAVGCRVENTKPRWERRWGEEGGEGTGGRGARRKATGVNGNPFPPLHTSACCSSFL